MRVKIGIIYLLLSLRKHPFLRPQRRRARRNGCFRRLLASRIAGYHSDQVLNAWISAWSFPGSFHLVLYRESYSHDRDFEWVLLEIFFFLLGRTIKVLLDFENTITDKAKPVFGYLITKKTQFLPQLSVTCLNI